MLPSNLLRAKISRGTISPLYASLDLDTMALAERISGIFRDATGRRRGELMDKMREVEDGGNDFKLVRGLSTLLERRCTFEAESTFNPKEARMAVFEEASRSRTSSLEERNGVIQTVSAKLGISPEAMERTLFSDLEDEVILREFMPLDAERLLKQYNLSVTQTLLFKSLRVEFTASGNWKNIFRDVKRLGLIYSVERGNDGFKVSLDGPLSLFKMTERYGTSIAKILPQIVTSDSWSIRAEILARSRGRVYIFEADGRELKSSALVIYYEKEVPLKPIIEHLKERDRAIVKEEVERFRTEEISLTGDIVSLDEIARERGVTLESVRTALEDYRPYGYARVGDLFLSRTKLDEIDEKLKGVQMLASALQVIEACGVKGEGQKTLDVLGYASAWEGMEMDKVKI